MVVTACSCFVAGVDFQAPSPAFLTAFLLGTLPFSEVYLIVFFSIPLLLFIYFEGYG